jgi:hypothetical protein
MQRVDYCSEAIDVAGQLLQRAQKEPLRHKTGGAFFI